jgi:nitric oxide reductase large subunit
MTNPLEKLKENNPLSDLKILHPTINAVVVVCAIIMLWRGVWGLLDEYLFPGSPTFSYLLSIALGALVLYLDDFSLKDLKR